MPLLVLNRFASSHTPLFLGSASGPGHWVFGTAKARGLNTDSNNDDPSLGYNGKFVPSHLHSMVSISKSIK